MKDGERQIGEMRWEFKLPDRLLFNARSDSVTTAPFWRERLHNRVIVPAASLGASKKQASLSKAQLALFPGDLDWLMQHRNIHQTRTCFPRSTTNTIVSAGETNFVLAE
jgi:hypothetical protein